MPQGLQLCLVGKKAWLKSRKCQVDRCSLISEYIIPADTPYPNYFVQAKSLTEAKKTNDELKSVNAQVLQQTLKVIDRAFNDMKSRGNGFPRYKKKLKSFVYPAMLKGCLADGKVKLPQLGWARIRQSRSYPEGFAPKQARIVRRASGYFLMIIFQSKDSIPDPLPGKKSLGIDAGIESFIATSDGELVKSPKFLVHAQHKLKLLVCSVSRKSHKTYRESMGLPIDNLMIHGGASPPLSV